jgi:hypothetical protein
MWSRLPGALVAALALVPASAFAQPQPEPAEQQADPQPGPAVRTAAAQTRFLAGQPGRFHVGTAFGLMVRGGDLSGSASSLAFTAGGFVTRDLSLEVEVLKPGPFPAEVFPSAPVDIPSSLVSTITSAELRELSRQGKTEQRAQVNYGITGFIGYHPPPFGRAQLGFRAGFGVQETERSFVSDVVVVREPGSYTLERGIASGYREPGMRVVVGLECRVAVTRHLSLVPEFRVASAANLADWSVSPGIGARWTF